MRRVLTGLVFAFSVACFGDDITGSSTVTGAYSLRSINGSPLPYTLPGTSTEVVSEVITLFQGGTYARSRDSRVTVNGQVSNERTTEGGTYSLFGTSISLRTSGVGEPIQGVINGNTMTFVNHGITEVFSK